MTAVKRGNAHIGLKMSESGANVERIVRDVTFLSPAAITGALESSLFCERVFVVVFVFVE